MADRTTRFEQFAVSFLYSRYKLARLFDLAAGEVAPWHGVAPQADFGVCRPFDRVRIWQGVCCLSFCAEDAGRLCDGVHVVLEVGLYRTRRSRARSGRDKQRTKMTGPCRSTDERSSSAKSPVPAPRTRVFVWLSRWQIGCRLGMG